MRKYIFLILCFIVSTDAFSQLTIQKDSFHKVDGCITIPAMYDINNQPMALLKISTVNINEYERGRFVYEGNLATFIIVEKHIGEAWVYLTAEAATFLKIKHPDYGIVEFHFPIDLKPKQCYEMVLLNKNHDDNLNILTIQADQPNAKIYVNDDYIGDKTINVSLPINSNNTWRIECEHYYTEVGSITISKGEPIVIDRKLRPSYGYINIKSKPEDNVNIHINDSLVGVTPYYSDKIESGTYKIELTKKNYVPEKREVVVSNGKTNELFFKLQEKKKNFVTLNYAYSTAPQQSYGLTFGQVRKIGWYASIMISDKFDAFSYDDVCEQNGSVKGEIQLYSGNKTSSRFSSILGFIYKPLNNVGLKVGCGYGMRILAWETTDKRLIRNNAYSATGIELNAGVQFMFGKLNTSLDVISTNMKYYEVKVGLGFNI